MFGLNHGLTVALTLVIVAIVVLGLGLMGGAWARRGSGRAITRDDAKEDPHS